MSYKCQISKIIEGIEADGLNSDAKRSIIELLLIAGDLTESVEKLSGLHDLIEREFPKVDISSIRKIHRQYSASLREYLSQLIDELGQAVHYVSNSKNFSDYNDKH